MRKLFVLTLGLLAILTTQQLMAQSLEKMNWFNEPSQWSIGKDGSFKMFVTPQTDYWRITHYGFTVDDAPFYYALYGGEFEVKVKIKGDYRKTFDQMGLMLRVDEKQWIKAGVEFVNGKHNISAVVTHNTSDWSVIQLDNAPAFLWIKALRRLDAVELFYSYDDVTYTMMRTCYLQDNTPVMVGLMAASPDGEGFEATFEHFNVKPLADQRRLDWAKRQSF